MIALRNDIYIGKALIKYGEYAQSEIDFLKRLATAGSIVVDAGANHGTHTVALARHVGRLGRIYAFEPQPAIFHILCGNVALNSLMNVRCFPCALSNAAGEGRLTADAYEHENNYGNVKVNESGHGVTVELRQLDHLFKESRLDLIKADVEGMEFQLLEGAENLLNRFRPALYLEDERVEQSPVLHFLKDLRYRVWRHTPPLFNPENFNRVEENDWPGVHSFNLLCLPMERAEEREGLNDPFLGSEI
jgi:FkbM family methyltransferase